MDMIVVEVFRPVRSNRATIVEVIAYLNKEESITVTGEALRHPTDRNDEELADMLAYGRAFESLGRKLTKRADGLVRHNDYIAEMKKRQRKNNSNKSLLKAKRVRKSESV